MPKGLDYIINLKQGSLSGATAAKSELSGMDAAVSKTGSNLTNLGGIAKSVGGFLVAAFATSAIFDFLGASNDAYRGMLKSDAQLRAGIASTGGAAGKTLEDLKAKADALDRTTIFGAEDTQGAQALLLTFKEIKGAVFDQAIPAIADMAQRLAGDGPADLKGASIQIGKALNDPIRGIAALGRVGVTFSEDQKAAIQTMVEHNNVAGAQALIIKELNSEFGGSAVAARQAAGGKEDLAVAAHNLQLGVGELISKGMEPLYGVFTSMTEGLVSSVEWFKRNADVIAIVAEVVGVAAGAYLLYQTYLLALQAPTALVTAGQWLLNAALTANPVGLIVVGIAALVGGFMIAYKKSETFRAAIDGLIEVGKLLGTVFMAVGKTIIGALTFDKKMFMSGLQEVGKVTEDILGGGIKKAFTKGFADSKAKSKADAAAEEKQTTLDALTKKPALRPNGKAPGGAGAAGKDTGTTLSSNKQVRNVTVTIGKLVESLTVSTTNLQASGSSDVKRMITEILTGAVHDSELALSNG